MGMLSLCLSFALSRALTLTSLVLYVLFAIYLGYVKSYSLMAKVGCDCPTPFRNRELVVPRRTTTVSRRALGSRQSSERPFTAISGAFVSSPNHIQLEDCTIKIRVVELIYFSTFCGLTAQS